MAPILKTYSKSRFSKIIDKDDTFDKLLRPSEIIRTSQIFESSSDADNQSSSYKEKSDEEKSKHSTHGLIYTSNDTNYLSALTQNILDISYITPDEVSREKFKNSRNKKLTRIEKKRTSSTNKLPLPLKHKIKNEGFDSLASSTPLSLRTDNLPISIGKNVSPIVTNETYSSISPKGHGIKMLQPKNILNSVAYDKKCDITGPFKGFENISLLNQLHDVTENFYGFPSISGELVYQSLHSIQELNEKPEEISNKTKLININNTELSTGISIIESSQLEQPSSQFQFKLSSSNSNSQSKNKSLSRSMQNLSVLLDKEQKKIVKSSSFDDSKTNKGIDQSSQVCRINIQEVTGDFNIDSSDIEESALNSADERSCSIRSGQLDEEESAFHSSEEENESVLSKDKDLIDLASHKTSSKGDSESAIFSSTQKDMSITNQSGEVSADDCDLYTESEIAKSSDSIEVSKTANLENASSDLSTSSDKEVMKDEDIGSTLATSFKVNSVEKIPNSKQNTSYISSKNYSTKSKESFYSVENSASDESELSFESDSELSCESSRSSRKSSLESAINISKETLDQLRECVSAINISKESLDQLRECVSALKIQDEYEDAICGKTRKSLAKRGSEWECPPSPRRSVFPLAPLFPLPENQEDPGEENGSGEQVSLCESTTASEDDSHHSGSRKSRCRLKDPKGEPEGRSSGEDESNKSSPVRETSRLRRSRRFSKKKESNCRLNMVIEESDSESTEADVLPQMEHIILPTGKKYRRSLSIIKHLDESMSCMPPNKGRHYDQAVESVIKLQTKSGFESPREGRISLAVKRKSLLSQCFTSVETESTRISRPSLDLFVNILSQASPLNSRASLKRLSCSIREDRTFKIPYKTEVVLEEEEEGEEEDVEEVKVVQVEEETVGQDLSISVQEEQFFCESSIASDTEGSFITPEIPHIDYEDLVMKCCLQKKPCAFSKILPNSECLEESCSKVGEGVYGEVFMIPRDNCKNVLKIIPIEGSMKVNDENQKTYQEIANELLIALTLSELREENDEFMTCGFTELIKPSIVKGRYPKKFIELWNEFDENKGSDNDSPTIFGRDQLYLVMELGNAGTDLESYSFSTAKQGLSVFKQTVCALAVAEAYCEFEHRDLHWGNVLVSRTSERDIPFILNKEKYTILTNGVKATIIDFTLSRMTLSLCPVFFDLSEDPDIFIGAGDYQFDIYRAMKTDVQNRWSSFVPKTNVRWLHYLVDKMIGKVRYQRKTAKVHTDSMKILKEIESWILSCDNALQVALKIVKYK